MDNLNSWARLRGDDLETKRYEAQTRAPFVYMTSFGQQAGCRPDTTEYRQCRTWAPGGDIMAASNELWVGEPFITYEPGHAVSTELVGRSPYKARGEGMLANIDTDSALRSEISDPRAIRAGKTTEDMFLKILPPLDGPAYKIVTDDGTGLPRGGDPTRVIARNLKN
jgi:hypothetical protein